MTKMEAIHTFTNKTKKKLNSHLTYRRFASAIRGKKNLEDLKLVDCNQMIWNALMLKNRLTNKGVFSSRKFKLTKKDRDVWLKEHFPYVNKNPIRLCCTNVYSVPWFSGYGLREENYLFISKPRYLYGTDEWKLTTAFSSSGCRKFDKAFGCNTKGEKHRWVLNSQSLTHRWNALLEHDCNKRTKQSLDLDGSTCKKCGFSHTPYITYIRGFAHITYSKKCLNCSKPLREKNEKKRKPNTE